MCVVVGGGIQNNGKSRNRKTPTNENKGRFRLAQKAPRSKKLLRASSLQFDWL